MAKQEADVNVATQHFQLYKGNGCVTTEGAYTFIDKLDSTRSITVPSEGRYRYKIFTTDYAGNMAESACSTEMIVDTTMPIAVTGAAFSGTPYDHDRDLTVTWTLGGSTDLVNHRLDVYSNSGCTIQDGR